MNPLAALIWLATLVAALVGVVPLVVGLLDRALQAARRIERYTDEILAGGAGIARNTASVAALKETIALAPRLVSGAESIERHTAAIENALAGPSRSGPGAEDGPSAVSG
jgi:hypothetical protein